MRNKKVIIGVLCLALVFMGIGFAAFSTSLNLNGTATASGAFDVKITNVTQNSKSTGTVNTTLAVGNDYSVTEQNLSAVFSEPGDYIIWDITVTNKGTINAMFSVGVYPQTSTSGAFEMKCNATEGRALAPSASTTFQCEMSFDKNHQLSSIENIAQGNMQIVITAVQGSGYESPPPTVANKCFLSFRANEINGYLISDPDCPANVVIPDNLTLGVREITSIEFDDNKCSLFESSLLNLDENYTCTNLKAQFNQIKSDPQVVFASFLGALTTVSYGDEGLEKKPITKVGDGVFAGMQLTGASIGEGISTIGLSAFGFNNITSLTLPSTLRTIGTSAFFHNSLTSVSLPSGLVTIGNSSFDENRLTGTLTIPASVETIGNWAFQGESDGSTNQITSIVFSNGSHLQTIGRAAFLDNNLGGTLTIPASVVTIDNLAFSGTSVGSSLNHLTSVVFLGNNLTTIGDGAFQYNRLFGEISIPSSVVTIGEDAFRGTSDGLKNQISSVVFNGNNLTTIEKYAFQNNNINGVLTLPASLQSIEYYAFYGNYVSELHLGSNIYSIGTNAFYMNNDSLTDTYINMSENNWNNTVSKGSDIFNQNTLLHFN